MIEIEVIDIFYDRKSERNYTVAVSLLDLQEL